MKSHGIGAKVCIGWVCLPKLGESPKHQINYANLTEKNEKRIKSRKTLKISESYQNATEKREQHIKLEQNEII